MLRRHERVYKKCMHISMYKTYSLHNLLLADILCTQKTRLISYVEIGKVFEMFTAKNSWVLQMSES
jgi:hypothetical protein